jgi:hypothetical protein
MPAVQSHKRPLPYVLKSIWIDSTSSWQQNAVMKCCVCNKMAQFPFLKEEAPLIITRKFDRLGWEIYKEKARCPECKKDRSRQKAYHARLDERHKAMPPTELIKMKPNGNGNGAETHATSPDTSPERVYLLTIAPDGTPTLRPLEGVKKMLLGDDVFLVIPE